MVDDKIHEGLTDLTQGVEASRRGVGFVGPCRLPIFFLILNQQSKMTVDNHEAVELDKGNKLIVAALVGSRAHGLHTAFSDWDWRGVYIAPTSRILSLGVTVKQNKWVEGEVDDTSYEIGKFLHLATKSNPSILEIMACPRYKVLSNDYGKQLVDLFSHMWSSKGVFDAFGGYSKNQEKKFLDDKKEHRERRWKYAVAYLRVLQLGTDLLATGNMSTRIHDQSFINTLTAIRNEEWSVGAVMDLATQMKERLSEAYTNNPDKQTNMEPINEFLLKVRRECW